MAGDARAGSSSSETITIRGKAQTLHLYGQRGNPAVIVSSGDGGWIHLGPHVAETLAAKGFFVVGFDARAYLSGFTSGNSTLSMDQVPADYQILISYAALGGTRKPILIGVSEGAGLSLLAATDPATKAAIDGVIGLGLPDKSELGWRWKDSLIYLTHGTPNEPLFSALNLAGKVAPTPLAAIHSTKDEFVPVAEIQSIMERARDPKKLWIINAADHRFSNNLAEFDQRLLEAISWIRANAKP